MRTGGMAHVSKEGQLVNLGLNVIPQKVQRSDLSTLVSVFITIVVVLIIF